ncbi:division plane positioning ATPase MipZ [Temperatibacter marinus]|uniref:Division plane positioning ATPase MipZ n=1 Tax=Temperatibacter marinus TaxID=1456591 RepID=A0AA52EHT4_9PROT|nr:division plane positioning ATPase MipZ [Temperatibacter marinus]WND02564.1 division plane positioning ATPase MipZ [Temperatibacter marinus]
MSRPYLIVLGNEKGGSGKSTTALHIVTALLHEGYRVGTIDLDGRQQTLTRYIENRRSFCKQKGVDLAMPIERVVARSDKRHKDDSEQEEKERFEMTYSEMADHVDIIIVDCPGADTFLARMAHTAADTLITPVNDSFVDVDLLAKVDPKTMKVAGPSFYAEMVWKARQRRMSADGSKIDWVVLRNRLSSLRAKNMENVENVLGDLRQRIGFRFVPGLGERVIYRELFLNGLTLLDLKTEGVMDGKGLTMSHVAARQELRTLIDALNLPFRKDVPVKESDGSE